MVFLPTVDFVTFEVVRCMSNNYTYTLKTGRLGDEQAFISSNPEIFGFCLLHLSVRKVSA
jgi:hypothetical protein